MKEKIYKAFCSELSVHEFGGGFTIGTPYESLLGEPLGFYALGPNQDNIYRLVDDGTTIPFIEASGASLESETRAAAFYEILGEYQAKYSDIDKNLSIENIKIEEVPGRAIQFMALLLRVQDLLLMTRERVESSFREDALEKIRERFAGKADIKENEPVSADLSTVTPDMVLQAAQKQPVAIFIANTTQKISEAVILHLLAMHVKKPIRVVAVLEEDGYLPRKAEQRASNFLDAVPRFGSDSKEALDRIEREVFGRDAIMQALH